jgi:hypothetical protein
VSVGIQCALCHSVVDDSLAPGIGRRLDGWANRDLDIGAIVALAPDLRPFVRLLRLADPEITQADVRDVLNSWGPGLLLRATALSLPRALSAGVSQVLLNQRTGGKRDIGSVSILRRYDVSLDECG